ncbi:DUF2235 domain-containing protein [Mesorhizobium sp. LSJC265A00]|uniref:DUF2235 domain-containing protein n=1 Tax=Mesorhizobium sp. LSJC265A00 TaxID=1287322 RepID=UPI0003F95264|nr:DUF2235 domain-containing protein [Mesorhizobium sp. LSJC265A00]
MPQPPRKRIAMFLDGTWNTVADNTNVWRLHALCAKTSADGLEQVLYYDQGVGTRLGERFRGGIFGYGLDRNIMSAYRWLVETYSPGDEIFVFGFSRGAFTARSLVGLVARCGLLQPGAPLSLEEVFERYRRALTLRPLYRLEFEQRELRRREKRGGTAMEDPPIYPLSREEASLLAYCKRVPIKMVGVFDTVGALGVPFGTSHWFHNTHLSTIYKNSYQALGIDEHRAAFAPTLWTRFTPDPPDASARRSKRSANITEQRWFVGAHANVGGGYPSNKLSQLPLAWMVEKAESHGLTFRYPVIVDGDSHRDQIVDSYSQFMYGLYSKVTNRHQRIIGAPRRTVTKGYSDNVNESIDPSVFARWREDRHYRPPGLVDWAELRKLDPAQLTAVTPA